MENVVNESEFSPEPIQSGELQETRQEFIAGVRESRPEAEVRERLIEFIKALQNEANTRFPGPERDLWFNCQLTRVYVDAMLWVQASKAVEDALLVANNMNQGRGFFEDMRQEIRKHLTI